MRTDFFIESSFRVICPPRSPVDPTTRILFSEALEGVMLITCLFVCMVLNKSFAAIEHPVFRSLANLLTLLIGKYPKSFQHCGS